MHLLRVKRRRGLSYSSFVRSYLAATSLVSLVDFIFGATYVALLLERSVEPAAIGVIFAVTNLILMVMEIPSGVFADRYGKRLATVLGGATWGVGLIIFVLSDSLTGTVMGLCIWAVGMAVYSGAPLSLAVNRAKTLGLNDEVPKLVRQTHIWRWIASAAGAAVSIAFAGQVGPQVLIAVGGVALVAGAVYTHVAWPEAETIVKRPGVTGGLRAAQTAWTEHRRLLGTTCIIAAPFTLMLLSWQPAAQDLGGLSIESLGIPLLFFSLAAALGAYVLGRVPRLISEPAALMAAVLLAGCLAAASVSHGWPVLAWYGAAELCAGIALAGAATLQHRAFSDDRRSTLASVFSAATGIVSALVSLSFGWLWQDRGLSGALVTVSACAAGAAVGYAVWQVLLRTRRTRPGGPHLPAPPAARPTSIRRGASTPGAPGDEGE